MNRFESFKPKSTKSDGRSDWRELEMEPGFRQEFKDWGRSDQLRFALLPSGVTRFVIRNIAPSADRSFSSGLNGSDLKQMSERQRMKTFPEYCRHLEYCFDGKPMYLQNMSNKQEHQSYQNIIYTSILVTKESSSIYMWDQYNRYVGWKLALH